MLANPRCLLVYSAIMLKVKLDPEALALNAVAFIIDDEQLISRFLSVSGLSPNDMRKNLQRPETMAAIVDFLLEDEQALVQFCQDYNLPPEKIWQARLKLPGSPAAVL